MLEPLNMTTAFLIERISDAYITAGQWTNLTMEITLLKGSNKTYLQQFLDATLHEWVIDIYVDTYMILELFGVTIGTPSHPLEAFGTKFTYIIDPDTIQSVVFGVTEQYASNVQSQSQELLPLGYGTWYALDDIYGGIDSVVNNPQTYVDQPWIWKIAGIVQGTGSYGPHYNDPSSPTWNEKRVFLLSGFTYHIELSWDSDADLDLYVYRPGEAPSEDGTGNDYYQASATTYKPEVLEITPDVSGWWTIGIDYYSADTNKATFNLEIYKIAPGKAYSSPEYVNVWDFKWILLEFRYSIQGGTPNATIYNFRSLMIFTGEYINGSKAHGDIRDYIGEIYIPEFKYSPDTTMFHAYLRLWRWNRFTRTNSSLKDYVYRMTLGQYNFALQNTTFDLELFGCYIRNISLSELNFTGIWDPWALSTKIEWKGLEKFSISLEWGQWWVVYATVHVSSPRSPSWLIYTEGEMWIDDDPVFNNANDPPIGTLDGGTWCLGPYYGPTGNAKKIIDSDSIEIFDAPISLPSYATFMGGGELTYVIKIDISFWDTISNIQSLLNMYVDSLYDDETQKADDAQHTVIWPYTGYGEEWSTCTWKTVTETLMFWWIIHVPSPLVAITSGDWLQSAYLPYRPDPNNETHYRIYISNINGRPYMLTQYMDSFDGRFDITEPDTYGNTNG